MFRFIISSITVLATVIHVAHAQHVPLTIREAILSASTNHPAARALEAEFRAAQSLRQQAAMRPNPEADFGAGYKDTDTDSGYALDVGLSFPIERSGKREARMGVAESGIHIAEAGMRQFQLDLELQVRTLAYEYLTAEADAEIAREIAERSRAMIELLKQRPAAGPAILLELRVIEGSLVEFQKSAREFGAQRDSARSALNILLGRADDAPLKLREDLLPPTNRFTMSDLSTRLENSPAMLKRLAEIERAGKEAKMAILEAKPDIHVGPYYSREDVGEVESTIGLAMSVPLNWRNRNQGTIAAAKAREAKAEAELAAEIISARSDLARRLRIYESAVEQVQAIPVSQIESLHDAADLADRQYRQGAIPVQLFLDMQREFLNVQLLRHNTLLESLTLAAELEWLAGSAIEENLP